ncbi:MAG: 50S ribosomal protein L18 [Syntrophales bacterium]|nr:50S ribosomal protein L18 [Syntrophales bacterium]
MATKRLEKVRKIREKREARVRSKIRGTVLRPRLSVFRSAKHIYVQAIADDIGNTLAAASTLSKELRDRIVGLKKTEAAREVGRLVAEKLLARGIEKVVFDRGRFKYHGRVKALAEGARQGGLKF